MFSLRPICLLSLVSLAVLAGCNSNGDWPNLSDKMPDPASRNRVIERADPSVTPREQDQVPASLTDAETLFATVSSDIETARQAFPLALEAFKKSMQADSETASDRVHLWLETQLALTRLSQTTSQLDAILFNDALASSETGRRSREVKDRVDTEVIAARQSLASQKPEEVS